MKRVAIFLRNTGHVNKFRRAVLASLRSPHVDEALLCSGIFQDDGKYSAGTELDLVAYRGCSPLKLTTLGLYSYSWKQQYATFFSQLLATNKCSKCFTAVQKRIPSMGWHAKFFLAKANGVPMVGIVGSSNITRRAFGELKDFNYECDVVMWDETVPAIDMAIEGAVGDSNDNDDVIVTTYDTQHRANRRSLESRMLSLEAEILSRAVPA